MSVSRGKFLKTLGKSLPGMVLSSGIAKAAQTVLGKIAAISGAQEVPSPSSATQGEPVQDAKIKFINSGPTDGSRIALTFDDGPMPGVTDRILDELKQRGLHATFFMIGRRIAAAPDLARRALAEGHEIGNHTFTHPNLTRLPEAQVEAEIQKTQDIMSEMLQHRAIWFRPPYGALQQKQAALVAKLGMRVVMLTVDPKDWSLPGEDKVIGTVLTQTRAGSIILCHDVHRPTANCMGTLLDGLLERTFKPVTLSKLIG
jgi:peptidoglycan/xylan/chitin deacetylase (PgdA/CDA1 family)